MSERTKSASIVTACRGFEKGRCRFSLNGAGLDASLVESAVALTGWPDFVVSHARGPLMQHDAFKVSLAGCPNGCARPHIADVGLIRAVLPGSLAETCTGCGLCIRQCPDAALRAAVVAEGDASSTAGVRHESGACASGIAAVSTPCGQHERVPVELASGLPAVDAMQSDARRASADAAGADGVCDAAGYGCLSRVQAGPERSQDHIIHRKVAGSPVLDSERCLACGRCVNACPEKALSVAADGWRIVIGGRLGRRPRLATELPGIHDTAAALAIVDRAVRWFMRDYRPRQRFADLVAADPHCGVWLLEGA